MPPPPVEAAAQGVTIWEDMVSGLMFPGDFVGISENPIDCRNRYSKRNH